jgi:site-specific DNA recombinase
MDKPVAPTTAKELTELLKLGTPPDPRDIDTSTLKYAIYARKSTTGDERQERSIPDQIADCINKVVNIDDANILKVVGEPIEEKRSAKDPGIRPLFKTLLEDVRLGKIDGIIAWHPDRLSRNMKEAGEIIDLLDKGILKDLRFATSTFENSPTGKMLLGISFVLSKQYSEHLSESVTRGNKSKTEAGIFFDEMKHGYVINDKGELYPDGENYSIIRAAFDKRLDGISNPEIAKWLNTTPYTIRKKNKAPAAHKWDKDNVGTMFRDPLYAGVLKYGNSFSNLEDFYDFTPVVTIDEFFKINKITDFSSPKLVSAIMANKREVTKANLLRGMVYCGYCNKPFTSSLTSKVLERGKVFYYLYRCETDLCEFKNKSVRANVVLADAYAFLAEHLFTTKGNYAQFVIDAREYAAAETKLLTSDIMSITKQVGNKKAEYDRAKNLLEHNPKLANHYNLDQIKGEQKELEKQLKELGAKRNAMKQSIMTYEQYLELFQSLSVKLEKTSDMALLDQILKKFFLNFTIKATGKGKQQRCEITHELKEPWATFVKSGDFERGRGDRT